MLPPWHAARARLRRAAVRRRRSVLRCVIDSVRELLLWLFHDAALPIRQTLNNAFTLLIACIRRRCHATAAFDYAAARFVIAPPYAAMSLPSFFFFFAAISARVALSCLMLRHAMPPRSTAAHAARVPRAAAALYENMLRRARMPCASWLRYGAMRAAI